jgi:hypothetical protein
MTVIEVFKQNNGDVTKAWYAEMNAKGKAGELAVALFRAQKRSTAAKKYRGRFTRDAYDVKNWSISEVVRILWSPPMPFPDMEWGWAYDARAVNFEHVLYVELPGIGQCSFHSSTRLAGPDFTGVWKPIPDSLTSILTFCDSVIG